MKEMEENRLVMREIDFCKSSDSSSNLCYDSFTLCKGFLNKKLNQLAFDETGTKQAIQRLSQRPPEVSIKLNHVYGIECFHRRDTLFYVHFYSLGEQKELDGQQKLKEQQQNKIEEIPLHPNYIKEMLFSKYTALPYDKKHHNCERRFCYFTSRVAVIGKHEGQHLNQTIY